MSCDQIDSLAIDGKSETTGLTTLLSEACDAVGVLGEHFYKTKMSPVQSSVQDISTYFARPRIVNNFVGILSTDNPQALQAITNFVMFNNVFPYGVDRLIGVHGVRYTIVITAQVSCSPFAQGLLALNWQYGLVQTGSAVAPTHRGSITGMTTSIPHVLMDLSTTTMVQLRVPWLSSVEFDTVNGDIPLGTWALSTVLPLLKGTDVPLPGIKVMIHLEDFEIIGATHPEPVTVNLQSGKKVSPVVKESEELSYPISSGVSMMGQAIGLIAKGIPSLSALAGPPMWALGLASHVIRYFGYAKPTVLDPTNRMLIQSHVNECNVDMPSAATVVGAMASNTLAHGPNLGHTNVDEMAFAYILGLYSQICRGYLNTSTPIGAVLYATQASPSFFWFRSRLTGTVPFCNIGSPRLALAASTPGFIPSNLFYLGSLFRFWKGGFKFRITFAKTKFHGGRVLFAYDPTPRLFDSFPSAGATSVIAPGPAANPQPSAYTAIFDLRDGNVFEFEVPYIATVPYTSFFGNIGSVTMTLLDALQAPATVSNVVQWLVEVKALSDFELAVPVCPRYPPISVTTPLEVRYQSGRLLGVTTEADAQECIGEKIVSVKQLIQIPRISDMGSVNAGVNDNIGVLPWFSGTYLRPVTAPATWPTETFGFGNYFANSFAFVKGSTDIHIFPSSAGSSDVYISVTPLSNDGGVFGASNDPTNAPSSNLPRIIHSTSQAGVHARLPAHQKVARYYSWILSNVAWTPRFQSTNKLPSLPPTRITPFEFFRVVVRNTSAAPVTAQMTRCAGDDAALAQYIGPPTLGLLFAPTGSLYDPDSGLWN